MGTFTKSNNQFIDYIQIHGCKGCGYKIIMSGIPGFSPADLMLLRVLTGGLIGLAAHLGSEVL